MSKDPRKKRIVLAAPFDGAFIWFINKDQMRHDHGGQYKGAHSYYQLLYGERHHILAPKIVSLSILYDEIIVAPADIGLPDYQSYSSGDSYYNPLIGLHHSWGDYRKNQDLLDHLVLEDIADSDIQKLLPKMEPWQQKMVMERINLQLILAHQHDAKILAGPSVSKIVNLKIKRIQKRMDEDFLNLEDEKKIDILDKYFNLVCFEFKAPRYDDLVALREDKSIMRYSKKFQEVLDSALKSDDPHALFKDIMQKGISKKELAEKVQSSFEISGRISTWVGLIPILGSVASAVGAFTDIAQKLVQKVVIKNSWYLLGPRMSEVLIHSRTKLS